MKMCDHEDTLYEMRSAIRDLNAYLVQSEESMVNQARAVDVSLQAELDLKKNEMVDYELSVKIEFYNDYFDDPLFEMEECLKHVSQQTHTFLNDREDHNEYTLKKNHPLRGEFLCYLLHTLVSRAHLEWDEILSLSCVHWEIIPRYQYAKKITSYRSHWYRKKNATIPVIYDKEHYRFYLPEVIREHLETKAYPIDLRKFERIAHALLLDYALLDKSVLPLEEDELRTYHSLEYLLKVRSDKQTISAILGIELLKILPASMSNAYMISPIRAMTRGTIMATMAALEYGWAINLGGGYHHAHRDKGGGFCFFNDYALATIKLRALHPQVKILYIDLDAHLGDGVIEFASKTEQFYIFDMYNTFQSDLQTIKKSKDGRFILAGIPLLASDIVYLELLKTYLPPFIDTIMPDFIFYNGGGDILEGDSLGRLSISKEGMKQRDLFVFKEAKKRKIPITMCLSGGYGDENYMAVLESLRSVISLMMEDSALD